MGSNVRVIYLYIVSFITLGMVITGIISTVNNIAYYFFPDDYVFFEEIDRDGQYYYDYSDELEKNEIEKSNYKREKIKNSVVSVVVIVIGAIMYRYHWNMIEKERNNA